MDIEQKLARLKIFTSFLIAVGGIYTVIRTKAPVTVEELGSQYCLIGPYKEHNVNVEVEICEPQSQAIKEAMEDLKKEGIKVNMQLLMLMSLPPT